MRNLLKLAPVVAALAVSAMAHAEWPDRPIRVIVPYSPGVGGDLMMRLISEDLGKRLGQPVIVDNREGAGGNIGTLAAARAAADGYTFLVGQTSNFVVNHHLYKSFPIDPSKAFSPVIHMGNTPSVLLTSLSVPANDFKAFTGLAAASRGKLNFGSPGMGSPVHLTLAAMNHALDLGMIGINYRGSSQVLLGIVAGELQLGFSLMGPAQQYIDAGKIRPLAVLGSKRIAGLPNTPTFQEIGLENMGGETWWAMAAPVGTPVAVLERMNSALRQAMAPPNVRKRLESFGIVPVASTREEMVQKMEREAVHWGRIVKELNLPTLE